MLSSTLHLEGQTRYFTVLDRRTIKLDKNIMNSKFTKSHQCSLERLYWLKLILNSNPDPEAVAQTCSVKKVFVEISQNSQENIYVRVSFLIKLPAWDLQPAPLLKKRLWRRCFPVNFVKFPKTPFLTELFLAAASEDLALSWQKQTLTGLIVPKFTKTKQWRFLYSITLYLVTSHQ